jgi:outer membrane immunogenic protein
MKKILVGVAIALALGTTQAAADGIDKRPPTMGVPPPVYAPTWSGFYIGAGIGAGAMRHEIPDNFENFGGDGIFGTVIAGWDWQIGSRTVFGIFVDYDFSDINTSIRNLDLDIDHNHTWSVGARLGWLSSPSTLWYLTGGYTEAEFEFADTFFGISDSRRFEGYFVGAGVDTRLAGNWLLRLEYRFSEFDTETVFQRFGLDTDFESTTHTARATLTYKFGSGWGSWGKW